MNRTLMAALLLTLAAAFLPIAHAGAPDMTLSSATHAPADPADPKAAVSRLEYAPALGTYRAFVEPNISPWRETNDRVRERGGWRAYAREAREPGSAQPSNPAVSEPAAKPRPASGGHSGHKMN